MVLKSGVNLITFNCKSFCGTLANFEYCNHTGIDEYLNADVLGKAIMKLVENEVFYSSLIIHTF